MATFSSENLKEQLKIASELAKSEEWQENEKLIRKHDNELDKKIKVQREDLVMMLVMKLREQMEKMEKVTKDLQSKVAKYENLEKEMKKMESINEKISKKNGELWNELEKTNKENEGNKEKITQLEKQTEKSKKENKTKIEEIGNEVKEVEKNQSLTYAQVVKQGWASKRAIDAEFSRCMNSVIMKYDKTKEELQNETISTLKHKLVENLCLEKVVPTDNDRVNKTLTKKALQDSIEVQKLPSPKQEHSKYSLQFRVILKKKHSKKALFSSLKSNKEEWKGCIVKNETPANLLRASISLEKVAWQIREKLKLKTRVITDAKERCLKLEVLEQDEVKGFKECGKEVTTSNENIFEDDHNIADEKIEELVEKAKEIMKK